LAIIAYADGMSTVRIPSALKFLITRRAYLAGEQEKVDRDFVKRLHEIDDNIKSTQLRLQLMRQERAGIARVAKAMRQVRIDDLAAIDEVIRLHPLELDPSQIAAVRGHEVSSALPRGCMSRGIYQYLGMAAGGRRGVTETAVFLVAKYSLDLGTIAFREFRHRVRNRMKGMAYEGRIRRIPNPRANAESWYELPSRPQR
jgi:hypothetical protein